MRCVRTSGEVYKGNAWVLDGLENVLRGWALRI